VELTSALHGLAHRQEEREKYLADPDAYARRLRLSAEQRQALVNLDVDAMVAMGTHPLVPFLARMNIERMRQS
jgi:2,3-dihydroxyphenylpropionate 1,2-dioxygenase